MAVQVPAPVRRPRQGGIKSVIDGFITAPRLNAPEGDPAWEDATCGFPVPTWADCVKPVDAEDKYGAGVTQYTVIGAPFARYKGVECWIGGDSDGGSFESQAASSLEEGEDREIELVLWEWASAGSGDTVDSLVAAIAAADEYPDDAYVGAPIIMMSRRNADLAYDSGILTREDGRLITPQGNYVLATGTADDDKVVALGSLAVYATPIVERAAIQQTDNLHLAIAERVYAIGVDCEFVYAVTIDTTP